VRNQLRQNEPLLDVRLFLGRGFTADAIVLYCGQFALIGQVAYNAIYMQDILAFAPLQAGRAMLLFLVPWMLMAPVAGWLYDRYGIKLPACLGMALLTVGFFLETQTFPLREFAAVAPCMVLIGMGLGLAMPQSYTDGMSRAPSEQRGQAYGVLDTVRQLGAAMGMAAIGSLVALVYLQRLGPIAEKYATSPGQQATLSELLRNAVRGQTDAARKVYQQWPAALDDLKTSGARSIADGYYVGTAVAALGLLMAVMLMTRKRPAPTILSTASDARWPDQNSS
jgi:MFS family permease